MTRACLPDPQWDRPPSLDWIKGCSMILLYILAVLTVSWICTEAANCTTRALADEGLLRPLEEWIAACGRPGYVHVIVDRSCSMDGDSWDQARAQADKVVQALDPAWHIQATTFSDSTLTWLDEYKPATYERLMELKDWLAGQTPDGNTSYTDAIQSALVIPDAAGAPQLVVIVSDAIISSDEDFDAALSLAGDEWHGVQKCLLWIHVGEIGERSASLRIVNAATRGEWRLSSQLAIIGGR